MAGPLTRATASAACAAAVVLVMAAGAAAQELPALTGPVNDFANVIDPDSAAEMDRRIRALQAASSDVVVVTTVKTFAPYGSIEDYAVRLFERAGIGTRAGDNGLLIVLAADDRRVRIEVGYGLEEFVTDGFAGEVIRRDMLPAFRDGRIGPGLLAGTTSVIQRIAERRGVTLQDVPRPEPQAQPDSSRGGSAWLIIAIVIWILFVRGFIRPDRRGGRRRRPWSGWTGGLGGGTFGGGGFGGFGGFGGGGFGSGGRSGGGFGGFGGGRSGGGGASGGW